jgi:hypothetical protein
MFRKLTIYFLFGYILFIMTLMQVKSINVAGNHDRQLHLHENCVINELRPFQSMEGYKEGYFTVNS